MQEDSHQVDTLLDPSLIESHTVRPPAGHRRPRRNHPLCGSTSSTPWPSKAPSGSGCSIRWSAWRWLLLRYLCFRQSAQRWCWPTSAAGHGARHRLLFWSTHPDQSGRDQQDRLILVNAVPPLVLIAITWWALRLRPAEGWFLVVGRRLLEKAGLQLWERTLSATKGWHISDCRRGRSPLPQNGNRSAPRHWAAMETSSFLH